MLWISSSKSSKVASPRLTSVSLVLPLFRIEIEDEDTPSKYSKLLSKIPNNSIAIESTIILEKTSISLSLIGIGGRH